MRSDETSNDANNYCRILTLLGMEEEGDPVAEVARLIKLAEVLQGIPQDAIDGGWTAIGMNAYSKRQEDQIATLRRTLTIAYHAMLEADKHFSETSEKCISLVHAITEASDVLQAVPNTRAAPKWTEEERCRHEQSERVMPLMGPLLDAFDGLSNDVRGGLLEDAPHLLDMLITVERAMVPPGEQDDR